MRSPQRPDAKIRRETRSRSSPKLQLRLPQITLETFGHKQVKTILGLTYAAFIATTVFGSFYEDEYRLQTHILQVRR